MSQEIRFGGLAASPSDYDCPDGQLSVCHNLINEQGALRPFVPPVNKKLYVNTTNSVEYIHETAAGKNIIFSYPADEEGYYRLGWLPYDQAFIPNPDESHGFQNPSEIGSKINSVNTGNGLVVNRVSGPKLRLNGGNITAMGNTLLVPTTDGIFYILWRGTSYEPLGTQMPRLKMTFGLNGQIENWDVKDGWGVNISDYTTKDIFIGNCNYQGFHVFSDDQAYNITQIIYARVNKAVNAYHKSGRFLFPFFVRYAYRLYDGSLTMHSAPVLMVPSTYCSPRVYTNYIDGRTNLHGVNSFIYGPVFNLMWRCDAFSADGDMDKIYAELPEKWADIIKSVDVFVSQPFYTYDQSGRIKALLDKSHRQTQGVYIGHWKKANGQLVTNYSLGNIKEQCEKQFDVLTTYGEAEENWEYGEHGSPDSFWFHGEWELPRISDDKLFEQIKGNTSFFLYKSFDLKDLPLPEKPESGNWTNISAESKCMGDDEVLPTIQTREAMTDDFTSHDTLIPSYSYVFNRRLNLAGLSRRLATQWWNGDLMQWHGAGWTTAVCIYMRKDGREVVVRLPRFTNLPSKTVDGEEAPQTEVMVHFFYPDPDAFRVEFYMRNPNLETPGDADSYKWTHRLTLPLTQHTGLNGAAYFDGFEVPQVESISLTDADLPVTSPEEALTFELSNRVYTSEINNPFIFPAVGANDVGDGGILGIASATKALSEGQFGQFPMYAFATDGVWALETASDGTWSAKQPISRDVCTNASAITQVDDAVVFPSERGLMYISGATIKCISDELRPLWPGRSYTPPSLPGLDKAIAKVSGSVPATLPEATQLGEFFKTAILAYDYGANRLFACSPDPSKPFALVRSMTTGLWSTVNIYFSKSLNSYPSSLVYVKGTITDRVDGDYSVITDLASSVSADNDASPCHPAIVVTRSLKLGAPDLLKTIDCLIARGDFARGNVKTILYGSRNLFDWHVVWSSSDHFLRGFSGSPYKYFRLAVISTLDGHESLSAMSVFCRQRLAGQPR